MSPFLLQLERVNFLKSRYLMILNKFFLSALIIVKYCILKKCDRKIGILNLGRSEYF